VELLTDPKYADIIKSLVSLKSQVFFSMLKSKTGGEEALTAFLRQTLEENRFNNLYLMILIIKYRKTSIFQQCPSLKTGLTKGTFLHFDFKY
jgi:hypothetical protein